MIYSKLITSTDITVPVEAFTSSSTGDPIGGAVVGQTNAITTMILCNTGTVDIADESVNTVNVNVYLVKQGAVASAANTIVSHLTIPAGETVFFSDEKIILDSGDEIWVSTNDSTGALIAFTVSALPV